MGPTQPTHINIALHAKTHTQRLKTGRIQRATSREKARPAETEEAHSKRLDAVKASQGWRVLQRPVMYVGNVSKLQKPLRPRLLPLRLEKNVANVSKLKEPAWPKFVLLRLRKTVGNDSKLRKPLGLRLLPLRLERSC